MSILAPLVAVAGQPAAPTPPAASAAPCARVVHGLEPGAYPGPQDLETAPCPTERPPAAFAYDPVSGLVRARRHLAAGDVVARPPAFALAAIRPGDRLRLVARGGSMRIEREVEAITPARTGQSLLVKGGPGEVSQIKLA